MLSHIVAAAAQDTWDAVLVGGGPCGIAVAAAFKAAGLRYAHLEQGGLAHTVERFPRGVRLYSTRQELEISGVPFRPGPDANPKPSPTREDYLAYLAHTVRQQRLRVHTHTLVERLASENGGHVVHTRSRDGRPKTWPTRNVVVASGGYYRPQKLRIPGESEPHVSHYFFEPAGHRNQRVLVVGGGNSAVESATELAANDAQVLLAYRGARLPRSRIKPWLLPRFDALRAAGKLRVHLRTTPVAITDTHVTLQGCDGKEIVSAERVYLLTGYGPDYDLLRQAEVPNHRRTGRPLFNARTLETKIPGIFLAGTLVLRWRGDKASIPNTRDHGEVLCDHLR